MTRSNKIRLLLLLAIVVVFGQVVNHDFVDWDDGPLVYTNPNIVYHTLHGLLRHWNPWVFDNTHMYNPLVFSLWWSIAHLSDVQSPDILGATLNPYIFHASNVFVHWLCACTVFEILRRLKIRDWPAAVGALVFAVHPLQTEVVSWVSAMKDVLSGLFALLTILFYLMALESRGGIRKRNYLLSTFFFVAALLSKPSTVVVPAICGLIDRVLYRRSWKDVARWTWPWYAMAAVITVIAASIQVFAHSYSGPLWARPLIALDSLSFYARNLLFPIGLKFDYGRSPDAVLTDPSLHHPLYWSWIIPVVVAVIVWKARQKMLTVAAGIFVLGVLPVLGLVGFAHQYYTTVTDRYVYLSMLGVALAVGSWMDAHRNRAAATIATAVIVVLGSLSFVQAQRWTDTETLYKYALDHTKPVHLIALGTYQDDLAAVYFRRAEAAIRAGDIAAETESVRQAFAYATKAMAYYRTAVRLEPADTVAFARIALDQKLLNQNDQAIATVKQWIAVDQGMAPEDREKPGRLQGILGTFYLKNRQYPEAVAALKQSLADADDPEVRKTLADAEKLAAAATRPGSTRP